MPVLKTLSDFARDCRDRGVPEIDVDEFRELIAAEPDTMIVDIREKIEWRCGRLPGAIHVSRGVLECNLEKIGFNNRITYEDLKRRIVFYCGAGDRSLLATERAMEMGFVNAMSLDGGYQGWTDSGGDVIVDKRFPS